MKNKKTHFTLIRAPTAIETCVRQSVFVHSSVRSSVNRSAHLFVRPSFEPVHPLGPFMRPSVRQSGRPADSPNDCPSVCPYVRPFARLFVRLFFRMFVNLSVRTPVRSFVRPSVSKSVIDVSLGRLKLPKEWATSLEFYQRLNLKPTSSRRWRIYTHRIWSLWSRWHQERVPNPARRRAGADPHQGSVVAATRRPR